MHRRAGLCPAAPAPALPIDDVASQQCRRTLLLKLSTAAAGAASATPRTITPAAAEGPNGLAGRWTSTYSYFSSSRDATYEGAHSVDLRAEAGQLVGRSEPQPDSSVLDLALTVDGSVATGRWVEQTAASGHYRAATYHGILQLVVDPTASSMAGGWLGVSRQFTIKSGMWQLRRTRDPR